VSDETVDPARVTALLEGARAGKAEALDALLPLVYHELRRVAGAYVRRERPGQTLQATGLVHEAYLRLMRDRNVQWQNKGTAAAPESAVDVEVLDQALARLAERDPDQARLVELRYFGGLTIEETADVLGVSPATVKRSWMVARAWLKKELGGT
jgi:RNA polymerase sigma-70 factor (ECF subfamily)